MTNIFAALDPPLRRLLFRHGGREPCRQQKSNRQGPKTDEVSLATFGWLPDERLSSGWTKSQPADQLPTAQCDNPSTLLRGSEAPRTPCSTPNEVVIAASRDLGCPVDQYGVCCWVLQTGWEIPFRSNHPCRPKTYMTVMLSLPSIINQTRVALKRAGGGAMTAVLEYLRPSTCILHRALGVWLLPCQIENGPSTHMHRYTTLLHFVPPFSHSIMSSAGPSRSSSASGAPRRPNVKYVSAAALNLERVYEQNRARLQQRDGASSPTNEQASANAGKGKPRLLLMGQRRCDPAEGGYAQEDAG